MEVLDLVDFASHYRKEVVMKVDKTSCDFFSCYKKLKYAFPAALMQTMEKILSSKKLYTPALHYMSRFCCAPGQKKLTNS